MMIMLWGNAVKSKFYTDREVELYGIRTSHP